MDHDATKQHLLSRLPAVDRLLDAARNDAFLAGLPRSVVVAAARDTVARVREDILAGRRVPEPEGVTATALLPAVHQRARALGAFRLKRTINATGVVVHTNLGRSLLAPAIGDHLWEIAARYSNLEFDLARGKRGSRYSAVEAILCEISGAEAAMVVNNNAGAVLLCLETLARARQVVVSRGELVEIGGAFRIPDVMAKSGAVLKEVGTTNRTHLRDYEGAIGPDTAMLLKVHTSNYAVVGFTASVDLKSLVALGRASGLVVMEDLGSGNFIDFSRYGLVGEPTVQHSVAAGVDVVTFSGDKLLGGPQAGIILGKAPIIQKVRANPLTRALRIDKLTLAALEATLHLYRDEARAIAEIPTLRMLTVTAGQLEERARALAAMITAKAGAGLWLQVVGRASKAGGGALPLLELPSYCLALRVDGLSAAAIEKRMRRNDPPIIGRIEDEMFLMDVRTIQPDEPPLIVAAVEGLVQRSSDERHPS